MEHNILWFRIAVISTFYKNPDIQKKIFWKIRQTRFVEIQGLQSFSFLYGHVQNGLKPAISLHLVLVKKFLPEYTNPCR